MSIRFVLKRNFRSAQTTNNPTIAEYDFDGAMFTIGSDSGNNLVLRDAAFEQAVIVREDEQIKLINRADGTKLNGEILRREAIQPVFAGDRVEIGEYLILVTDAAQSNAERDDYPAAEEKLPDAYAAISEIPVDIYATTKFSVAQPDAPNAFVAAQQTVRAASDEAEPETASQKPPASRNFADILDTLRTEDDSFYFTVKTDSQAVKKITLEQAETPLGISAKGEIVSATEEITSFCAIAGKDWSGILLESQKPFSFAVNGEKVETSRRLRHDDEIVFAAAPKFSLVLHEPSSLVALESLLSSRGSPHLRLNNRNENIHSSAQTDQLAENPPGDSLPERRYFKYFSFVEFISMIIGTMIGAVLIFLLLEFLFS